MLQDDDMFARQFRLCREDFGDILVQIQPLIERNEMQAMRSSGSSICPELRLMMTLRVLAGYLYKFNICFNIHFRLPIIYIYIYTFRFREIMLYLPIIL